MEKQTRNLSIKIVTILLIAIAVYVLMLSTFVKAYYSGETASIDLTGEFTSIDNCTSSIPLNYSISGLMLYVTIPSEFSGNLTLYCSGWNDESTHTTETVTETIYSGGSIIYRNVTKYVNQSTGNVIPLSNESNSTNQNTNNILSPNEFKSKTNWLMILIIASSLFVLVILSYFAFRKSPSAIPDSFSQQN